MEGERRKTGRGEKKSNKEKNALSPFARAFFLEKRERARRRARETFSLALLERGREKSREGAASFPCKT